MSAAVRNAVLLVSIAAATGLFLAIRMHDARNEAQPSSPPLASGALAPEAGDGERLARLEQRLEALSTAFALLSARFDGLEARRELAGPARDVPHSDAASLQAPGGTAEPRGPEWYLDQYVLSFQGGGAGSEYFRLAVEAFAPSLLAEISALVGRCEQQLRGLILALLERQWTSISPNRPFSRAFNRRPRSPQLAPQAQ